MIKLNLVGGLIILGMVVNAQTNPTPPMTPPAPVSPITKAPESKKVKLSDEGHDHFMINFTIDNVINGSSDSFFKSNVFNPNLGFYFLYDLPLGKSGLSVAPGAGFTFSKVNLDGSVLVQNDKGTSFIRGSQHPVYGNGATTTFENASFYSSWLEIPFELRYISKPINGRSRIKVAAGMRAGLNLTTNSKINYYDKGFQREQTHKGGPFDELASFRYGATFRIGYGAINLFGYYGLNQMIKENRNYNNLDLRQYSVGISLTGM
jgi:hypothetical protein